MKFRFSAVVLFALLIPLTARCADDAREELGKLQGTWVLTAMEKNGNAAPEFVLGKLTLTFKGDTMAMGGALTDATRKAPDYPQFTVTLDPSKKPKAIDATPSNGEFKGKTVLGIYQRDGEELKICLPKQGDKQRPSDFRSPVGSDVAFMTFKRSTK